MAISVLYHFARVRTHYDDSDDAQLPVECIGDTFDARRRVTSPDWRPRRRF